MFNKLFFRTKYFPFRSKTLIIHLLEIGLNEIRFLFATAHGRPDYGGFFL